MPLDPETPESLDPAAEHAAAGAAHWLAVLSDENCTDAERQQFYEWLRASTHNVDEFLRLSTLARFATRRELWPTDSVESLVAAARASTNVTPLRTGSSREIDEPRRRWLP
jgi:ferric-dicitrate binding protein FerR (iron transport regulator)